MSLQESLRALAADDAANDEPQVSAHVDAAVMAAWEAVRDASRSREARMAPRAWVPWTAACAAVVIAAVLVTWKISNTAAPSRTAAPPAPLINRELVLVPDFDRAGPLMLRE